MEQCLGSYMPRSGLLRVELSAGEDGQVVDCKDRAKQHSRGDLKVDELVKTWLSSSELTEPKRGFT